MKILLVAIVSAVLTLGATALVASAGSDQSNRPDALRVARIGDTVDMREIDLRCRYYPSPTGASGSPSFTCTRRSIAVSGSVVTNTLVAIEDSSVSVIPANHRVVLALPGRVHKTFAAGNAAVDRAP